jgi:hypothetical protein
MSEPPEWLRDAGLALAAFIGGHGINALSESRKSSMQMRDSVNRLALGVESVSIDLREIKAEIHEQVGELKKELHAHQKNTNDRTTAIENRVDLVHTRVDQLIAQTAPGRSATSLGRLAWERTCPPIPQDDPDTP